jgi:predicted  nucleic acid-binding Zn-ribbon protein
MTLRPQVVLELRAGQSIQQCENCRSIIYVEPPPQNVAEEMS